MYLDVALWSHVGVTAPGMTKDNTSLWLAVTIAVTAVLLISALYVWSKVFF